MFLLLASERKSSFSLSPYLNSQEWKQTNITEKVGLTSITGIQFLVIVLQIYLNAKQNSLQFCLLLKWSRGKHRNLCLHFLQGRGREDGAERVPSLYSMKHIWVKNRILAHIKRCHEELICILAHMKVYLRFFTWSNKKTKARKINEEPTAT